MESRSSTAPRTLNAATEQVLKEAGFTDIEFSGSGRLPYLWKSMVLKAKKPA